MYYIRLLVLLLLALLLAPLANAKHYGSAVVERVTSIYDADTFRVDIEGWPAVVGERVPVRIKGVDAPELRGKCQAEKEAARVSKQFTVARLRRAQKIELREIERGKYFRLLAHVSVDGADLGQALISAGLARSYDGGRRQSWCKAAPPSD